MRIERFCLVLFAALIAVSPVRSETVDGHLRRPEGLLDTPCPTTDSLRLPKTFFTICYHTEWRVPRWVAYHLTAADLEGDVGRTEDFREDKDIPNESQRSKLRDYAGSGYHRGHMAPAEAFDRSVRAMSTTFLLSNMVPQTASLKLGKWRSLEARVLKVVDAHRGVWVITGNLFAKADRSDGLANRTFERIDPLERPRNDKLSWIGNGRVTVPTHSYKAILVARDNGTLAAYGFIMPNQRTRLPGTVADYQVKVRTIENLTGIDVFAALDEDEENRLEKSELAWPPKRERRP